MMVLVKKDDLIECENPWSEDKLDRKEVAQYLTKIIGSIRQPFVVSLNSPYGTGKTFFIKHWQAELLSPQQGYKAVYFNAWDNDYTEDALVAFISSIREQIKEISNAGNEAKLSNRLSDLVTSAQPYLTKNALPVLAKILTRLAVGAKTADDIEGELASLAGEVAKGSLKRHEEIKNSIVTFKNELERAVAELTNDVDSEDKKKLIVFVDELDRCSPHYAIKVLECIKHLFNVTGLVFILAIDEEQITNSINSAYGLKQSGEGYLNKFIDWQIKLPEPSRHEYTRFLFEDVFGLDEVGRFGPHKNLLNGKETFINAFSLLSEYYRLTLRQQDKCFISVNLVVRSLKQNESPLAEIFAIISVLRVAYQGDIYKYFDGEKPITGLMELLAPIAEKEGFKSTFGPWESFKPRLQTYLLDENSLESLMGQKIKLEQEYNKSEGARKKELENKISCAQKVIDTWAGWGFGIMGEEPVAKIVYKRLEKAAAYQV